MSEFLPVSKSDMEERGWDACDFILITGDAYVDHPSFGAAVISRYLEHAGYRIGIISQPDWRTVDGFKILGKPKLAFLITAGNVDSMVAHYTAAQKPRSKDLYSPGGRAGLRPNRASIVYSAMAKQAYKGVPVILGGLEASLRRLSHYDYWQDKVRRSILLDAKADILVYGMGERAIAEIAERLAASTRAESIRDVRGTVVQIPDPDAVTGALILPSYEEVSTDKRSFAESFRIQYRNTDPFTGKPLLERSGDQWLLQNPPAIPLSRGELDTVYELPYTRSFHPMYSTAGGVPAAEEVSFSLTSSRGCFGECSFCSLTFHQGRIVQGRSSDSLVREAETLIRDPAFKGYIHDVGGPTANFRAPACPKQGTRGSCPDKHCLFPSPCKNLKVDHREYLSILRRLRSLPGVKKVFIRSGVRFDYLMADPDDTFFVELVEHHVSGQLKVAPEHVSAKVLQAMRKPRHEVYESFKRKYYEINKKLGKKQYLVPYLISSHPGSGLEEAIELAVYLKGSHFIPEQVQDFYPTPGTLSTCMYYTGIDPLTGQNIYVPKTLAEKAMQRALLQFSRPENYERVREALIKAGRQDLIGYGPACLIRPYKKKHREKTSSTRSRKRHPNEISSKD